jgi:AcrR family transcriptional regulator
VSVPAATRSTRRDAVRNRQAVLRAATELFSEVGVDAAVESIAARAGVGVGTVYRHFPNKDALVDALVVEAFADVMAAARDALSQPDGAGLESLLRAIGRSMARHRGYAHLFVGRAATDRGGAVLRRHIAELVERAHRAGRLGPDTTLGDVMSTIWALRGVIDTSAAVAPDAWQRHLEIHLAALQAPVLQTSRPALTAGQLARLAPAAAT